MTPRLAEIGEAEALARTHALAFDTPWEAKDIARMMTESGGFALAAGATEQPAGFILCRAVAGEAEILTLAVDPALRRRGLAAALVEAAAMLAGRGASDLFLEVAADNEAAIALYQRTGFVLAGRRPGYYARREGPAVDALVMRRALNS